MDITGKIIQVLPLQSGVSQRTGNAWQSQEYVIETHDQYPKKCCFKVFGEDKIKQFNIQMGAELTVSFDIDAHEYNGRWFNQVNAWKVEAVAQQGTAPTAQPPQQPQTATPFPPQQPQPQAIPASDNDTLPF